MPLPPEEVLRRARVRERGNREAARRREAVATLRLIADVAAYASVQAGNGLGPAEARRVIIDAAEELAVAAGRLRHLARLGPAERRRLALLLTAQGLSGVEVAARLGIGRQSVYRYRQTAAARAEPRSTS
jgi:hypothetical protein